MPGSEVPLALFFAFCQETHHLLEKINIFFYISVLYNRFSSQPLKFSLFSIKCGLYNTYFLYFSIVLHLSRDKTQHLDMP